MEEIREKILLSIDRQRDKLVELLRELIKIPSLSGEENEVARFISGTLMDFGFQDVIIDDISNVICTIKGSGGGPVLLYNGHIDVVPVGDIDRWPADPREAPVIENKVIGRGACDMKGSVAAMMIAADALKESGVSLMGDLILTMVGREETGLQEGTKYSIEKGGLKPDIALIGEATNMDLCLGSRGRIVVEVSVHGKLAHAANASVGVNAVVKMQKMVDAIMRMELPGHEILGGTTQTITNIACKPGQINMVPDLCTITIDRRVSPGDSLEKTKSEFQAVIDILKKEDPDFSAEVKTGKFAIPGYKPPEGEVIARLQDAAQIATGNRPEIKRYIFGTDGSYLSGVAEIPSFGFGPGNEANAHTVNDHVAIDDLTAASKAYAMFVLELLM
jgi:acetylornithine deacetylase/succinyl-diaminopimelate desuccinylase family protein